MSQQAFRTDDDKDEWFDEWIAQMTRRRHGVKSTKQEVILRTLKAQAYSDLKSLIPNARFNELFPDVSLLASEQVSTPYPNELTMADLALRLHALKPTSDLSGIMHNLQHRNVSKLTSYQQTFGVEQVYYPTHEFNRDIWRLTS
jgi:hypothetical protein